VRRWRRRSARSIRPSCTETPAEALSLTNLTECGTAYRAAEIALYAGLAKEKGLHVHLDGARLGNVLASRQGDGGRHDLAGKVSTC
jgi:threonine aldolase